MLRAPEGVNYQAGWEDSECASVEELVCSCGADLLEVHDCNGYTVSHEDIIECPKCKKRYQFIWMGMIVKELNDATENKQ